MSNKSWFSRIVQFLSGEVEPPEASSLPQDRFVRPQVPAAEAVSIADKSDREKVDTLRAALESPKSKLDQAKLAHLVDELGRAEPQYNYDQVDAIRKGLDNSRQKYSAEQLDAIRKWKEKGKK